MGAQRLGVPRLVGERAGGFVGHDRGVRLGESRRADACPERLCLRAGAGEGGTGAFQRVEHRRIDVRQFGTGPHQHSHRLRFLGPGTVDGLDRGGESGDIGREQSRRVQGGAEAGDARRRPGAHRGHVTGDTTVGRGPGQGARGLRAQRERHHTGRDRGGRAAGGTARCVGRVVGVAGGAGLEVRELRGHGLAQGDGAGRAQPVDEPGVGLGDPAPAQRGTTFRGQSGDIDDVLHTERHTAQWSGRCPLRLGAGAVGVDPDPGTEVGLGPVQSAQCFLDCGRALPWRAGGCHDVAPSGTRGVASRRWNARLK